MLSMIVLAALGPLIADTIAAPCPGNDLAIVSAKSLSVTTDQNGRSTYKIAVTVTNIGKAGEAPNALESVDLFVDGEKADAKGLSPLAAGASQKLFFAVERNVDGQKGSTALRFTIDPPDPCNPANDTIEKAI